MLLNFGRRSSSSSSSDSNDNRRDRSNFELPIEASEHCAKDRNRKETRIHCFLNQNRTLAVGVVSAFLLGAVVFTVVTILRLRSQVEILSHAGPIGFVLNKGNRWVMTERVASGVGRKTLIELEEEVMQASPSLVQGQHRWGERCWTDDKPHVLVACPYNPAISEVLLQNLVSALSKLECGNPGLNLELALTSHLPKVDDAKDDTTGRSRIAAARNYIVDTFLQPRHSFVFWLDADVYIPDNIITLLHAANPHGISAPLVLLDTSARARREFASGIKVPSKPDSKPSFYDTAAFVQQGQSMPAETGPDKKGKQRNYGTVTTSFPYFNMSASSKSATTRQGKSLIPCDSVGTIYLIPAQVYRWNKVLGDRMIAIRHYAHLLTEVGFAFLYNLSCYEDNIIQSQKYQILFSARVFYFAAFSSGACCQVHTWDASCNSHLRLCHARKSSWVW